MNVRTAIPTSLANAEELCKKVNVPSVVNEWAVEDITYVLETAEWEVVSKKH